MPRRSGRNYFKMKKIKYLAILGMVLILSSLVFAGISTITSINVNTDRETSDALIRGYGSADFKELGITRSSQNHCYVKVEMADGSPESYSYDCTEADQSIKRIKWLKRVKKKHNIYQEDYNKYVVPIDVNIKVTGATK